MARLELQGLRKSFGATHVLHGVDLAVADGEMLVIVGASGCGKSTLLRLVAGLDVPTAGRILLDGSEITRLDPSHRDMAMVFQNYALYPHMSVFDNMAYGLRIRGMTKPEIGRRVGEAAALLGLDPSTLSRKPRQLSGGQRQRVAMGRAIVREPKLFLFDEPLSNLDAKLRVQMRAEIRRLQRRLGVTSLYVTHDQVEAMTLGDRLLVMNEGRPAQLATPIEVFERPANRYVAGFIGAPSMNFLEGELTNGGRAVRLKAGYVLPLPGRFAAGQSAVAVGIRPEYVTTGEGELSVQIELIEPLGSEAVVHGRLPGSGEAIVARISGTVPAADMMTLALPPEHVHLFALTSGIRIEPQGDPATASEPPRLQ